MTLTPEKSFSWITIFPFTGIFFKTITEYLSQTTHLRHCRHYCIWFVISCHTVQITLTYVYWTFSVPYIGVMEKAQRYKILPFKEFTSFQNTSPIHLFHSYCHYLSPGLVPAKPGQVKIECCFPVSTAMYTVFSLSSFDVLRPSWTSPS